jgi:sigma-B regulation protein RsbU (phosphoserine phosphatase)
MTVLIAEDDPVSRRVLETFLRRWGYEVESFQDGAAAWERLQHPEAPSLVILDWMMPGMGGVEICRRVRQVGRPSPAYLILLTSRTGYEDTVEGLEAGADDYVTKPFNREELRARVQGGKRVVELQRSLAQRVEQLEQALKRVKQLQGLLPICSYCKKIRNDRNYWQQVDAYITEHSDAIFSHGICPECFEKFVTPELNKMNGPGGTGK